MPEGNGRGTHRKIRDRSQKTEKRERALADKFLERKKARQRRTWEGKKWRPSIAQTRSGKCHRIAKEKRRVLAQKRGK